jgi:hypothetical protein
LKTPDRFSYPGFLLILHPIKNFFILSPHKQFPNMSKKLFLLPMLLGALLMFAPGCGDKCEKKDCGNGTCLDGTCDCEAGYEYDADGSCKVEARAKILGELSTTEQCSTDPNPQPYTITISAGSTVTDVLIYNFYASYPSTPVKATLSGTTLTIAKQKPVASETISVEGSGTIDASATPVKVTITYKVTDSDPLGVALVECNNTVFVKK